MICLISWPLLIASRHDWYLLKGLLKGFKLALRPWESSNNWWKYDRMKFVTLDKIAKSLFKFFFFSFYFILDLLHRREYGKVSHSHSYMIEVMMSHHMMSHNRHGKIVHRPCSSCISSIENLMGTLSSSFCQSLNKEQLALFWLRV